MGCPILSLKRSFEGLCLILAGITVEHLVGSGVGGIKKYGIYGIRMASFQLCQLGGRRHRHRVEHGDGRSRLRSIQQYTIWLYRYTRTPPGYTLVVRVGHVVL